MKKVILGIMAFLVVCAWTPRLAQAAPQDEAQSQAQAARKPPSPEEVVSRLDRQLSLTDDQKAKITPIIADRQQKMQALMTDQSASRREKRQKMKSIMQDSDNKIKAALTDEQKQKYTEMQQHRREQMKERRHHRMQENPSQ